MTMSETIVDEAHRLLDSIEPTCENRGPSGEMDCSAEATWMLRVSCGDSAFFCEGHQQVTDAEISRRDKALRCARHGGAPVGYDWVAL